MFTTVCPGCEASLNAPDTLMGKKVKCKKCGEPFVARPADADEAVPPRKTVKMKAAPPSRPKRSDNDDATEEAPAVNGKKSRRPADDDDTEVMESVRDDDEEDEPRPRKKGAGKGKKKKTKEGSPAMLIVLIAVGAIVLLGGGGVAAYFAFFDNEEPKIEPLVKDVSTPGTTLSETAAPTTAGWVDIHEQTGKYRIKFPSQPRVQSRKQNTPLGEVEVKMYMAGGESEGMGSAHMPIGSDRGGQADEQVLNQAAEMLKGLFKGAESQGTKPISYQGHSGRDETWIPPDKRGLMVIRLILAGDRIIVLIAGGDNMSSEAPRLKAFFDSLRIE